MSYYLYRHIRKDLKIPFYIGIGTKKYKRYTKIETEYLRAYCKSKRSNFWNKIVAKTDYEVEIIFESDDYEFIKQKEIEFIALYGRRNLGKGTLVNLTDGGGGVTNMSEEFKSKQRISKIGVNNPQWGKKGEESPNFGKKGYLNPIFGKSHSDEHIEKRISNLRSSKIVFLYGEKLSFSNNCIKCKPVINIETLQIWQSVKVCAEYNNYSHKSFEQCVKGVWGKSKKYKNYIYLENYEKDIK